MKKPGTKPKASGKKPKDRAGRLTLVKRCRRCRCPINPNVREFALCPRCRYRSSAFDDLIDGDEKEKD